MIMSDDLIYINLKSLKDFVRIRNFSPKKEIFILYFVDDLSKICWIEILQDKKPLTIIFATLNAFNNMNLRYKINVHSVLTYKKSEFYLKELSKDKNTHAFERFLIEMNIKHKYFKNYTKEKDNEIKKFWTIFKNTFVQEFLFDDIDDLKNTILNYITNYNEHAPQKRLSYRTPLEYRKYCLNGMLD
jgi:hypothetical protein